MVRARSVVILTLMGLVPAACGLAKPDRSSPGLILKPGAYPLQWVAPQDEGRSSGMPAITLPLTIAAARPPGLKGDPASGATVRFATLKLGPEERSFALAFVETKGAGTGPDALYADTNGDGDLAGESKLAPLLTRARFSPYWRVFRVTFACLVRGGVRRLPVELQTHPSGEKQWGCSYRSLGYWRGELGTSRGKLALSVANPSGSGRLDRRWEPGDNAYGRSTLLCLDPARRTSLRLRFHTLAEAQLIEGRLYRFTPDGQGRRLTIAPYQGPTGTLRAAVSSPKGARVRVSRIDAAGDRGEYEAESSSAPVPAGRYRSASVVLECGPAKPAWSYTFDLARPAEVRRNAVTDVQVGGKLALRAMRQGASAREFLQRGGQAEVMAELRDAFGNSVRPYPASPRAAPLTVALLDAKGKRLAQNSFGFG